VALDDLVEEMRRAVTANDVRKFRDADLAFHTLVSQIAGNPFLTRMREVLEPSLRALRVIADPLFDGGWHATAEEHSRLVSLLRSRDGEAAAEAFAAHAAGLSPAPDPQAVKKGSRSGARKK